MQGSVQLLSCVQLFATAWTAARQASLSITNSQSLLKLMSIMLVMPFNHLLFCCPLLLLPSVFPSIRVLSNEPVPRIRRPKCWSFSIHHPKIEISLFLFALLNFLARARFWASAILHYHQFSSVQFSHSVVSDSLQPHELQHARPPCPSPTPRVHPNSCPSSW